MTEKNYATSSTRSTLFLLNVLVYLSRGRLAFPFVSFTVAGQSSCHHGLYVRVDGKVEDGNRKQKLPDLGLASIYLSRPTYVVCRSRR